MAGNDSEPAFGKLLLFSNYTRLSGLALKPESVIFAKKLFDRINDKGLHIRTFAGY